MVGESLEAAIQGLKAERERLDSAIASLEGLMSGGNGAGGGGGRRGRRKPGRPFGGKASAPLARAGGRQRKNAPRGLLKTKIHEVLKLAKKPVAPARLRDAVIKAGYPNKNLRTLYTAVFTTAKKDPAIKKTPEGFSLK